MSILKYAATVLAAGATFLAIPTTASADWVSTISQELKAGNRVEQALVRGGYGRYMPTGLCDKQGRRFWCSVSGSRGNCFLSGQAWVSSPASGYRVRFTGLSRECY